MKLFIRSMMSIFMIVFMLSVFIPCDSFALHEVFDKMDQNHDGKVVFEEFADDMSEYAFEKIDSDNDDEITKEEWNRINDVEETEAHRDLFKKIDRNKDKKLTFSEFSDYSKDNSNIEKSFMGLDKDDDNYLFPDDISSRPVFRMITIKFGKKPPKTKK